MLQVFNFHKSIHAITYQIHLATIVSIEPCEKLPYWQYVFSVSRLVGFNVWWNALCC